MIRLNAYGVAVPKGSKKIVTHGKGGVRLAVPRLVETEPQKVARWQELVAGAALIAIGDVPRPIFGKQVALAVRMEFRFERPSSVRRSYPSVKPDIDKLARAVCDALTGLAWVDDSQVVDLHPVKRYCEAGESPGAAVEIELMEPMRLTKPAQPELRLLQGG
jgi:Holliday junction resolvase RusA-like endonuclease